MTFAEVKKILDMAKFDMDYCSILEESTTKEGSGVVALLKNGVYKIYNTDRNEPFNIQEYTSEDAASREFYKRILFSFKKFYNLPESIL